ncbi:hypothetical protein BT63DRAFT_425142 [Microthyrium microscopicum]|uniref:Azaphilone pigments biosynthesis cluster protein L N-terminal domain-containing protein n=1 Tax=Microthyrium microscopicum TaxID=703497 RepID=A0A6A6UEA5_9PEZI|nr:hypothetical protein BT63DRAFT_425142 [Microthyrium microscopicum]
MDAAGTALGAVSLGLSILDGVIEYCQKWKDRDKDINDLQEFARDLYNILDELRPRLTGLHSISLATQLESCITRCENRLQKLLDRSFEFEQTSKPLKNLWRKAVYPFKKESVFGLREALRSFQDNLNLALNLWNL